MPRQARHAPGDLIYHVLNRGAGGMKLFRGNEEYAAFLRVLSETMEQIPMRVCGYCLMGTHWHLILWPRKEGELARFMQRLTITHVRRWVEHRHRVGMGSVYQGRYKSFVVQDDPHLSTLARYVDRNPLRANLVERAEQWRWSSLGQAFFAPTIKIPRIGLTPLPLTGAREDWIEWVNLPQTAAEEQAVLRPSRTAAHLAGRIGQSEWRSAWGWDLCGRAGGR